jgi:hypothetical protein
MFSLSIAFFLLATSAVVPSDTLDSSPTTEPVEVLSGWVFEGCWSYTPAGPCKDIFRDSTGQHWICKNCGTTGTPNKGKCSKISQATLNTGYWCS